MAFKKGQSGNPLGSRVNQPWKDALERALAALEVKDKDGKVIVKRGEALRAVADEVVRRAIMGDDKAWKELGERLDGRALQQIDLAGSLRVETIIHRVE